MDQENAVAQSGAVTELARKSWTAYVRLAIFYGLPLLFLAVPLAWGMSTGVGLLVLALVIVFLVYQALMIRSHVLFCNDAGVWQLYGILPWNKGVRGVKWRDLDEAVFFQGMGSWMFKSYTIRVGHRFTKANELVMAHMARGHEAVLAVNATHQDMVRRGVLS